MKQHTLAKTVRLDGEGLHSGKGVNMVLHPAPAGQGIVFRRTDMEGAPEVPARIEHVVKVQRATVLQSGEARVRTVEHLLAAVSATPVVNSGSFGQGDGSLSVVNPNTLQEVGHHPGFGEFPGDIAISVAAVAYVSSFGFGLAVWDIVGDTFINPPSDPMVVAGQTISSGVGFDAAGRLYTLIPGDCISPSVAYRVAADTTEAIVTGACPIDITFTRFGN